MKGKNINFKFSPKAVCAIFFIIGVALIAISSVNFDNPFAWWSSWGKSAANNAGTTMLVAGIISFLMEVSTLKSFFQDSMKNILNDKFPFEAYSTENLINFRNSLSAYLTGENFENDELNKNTIYSYEDKLLELSKSKYYDFHNAKYTVYPNEENGLIRINADVEYRIINKFNEKNEIKFKTKTYALKGGNGENNFSLQKLIINGQETPTDNLVKIEKIDKQEDSNFYDYKVKIIKDLGKGKNVSVHMKYEYNIPIHDRLQSYKITLPCRKMEHEIRIKGTWNLRGSAYTAFYVKQDNSDCKFNLEQSGSDTIRIKFNDWVFPGSGYSIYYDKNNI